jgi:predicted metal-dependent phosphoesterase TrpH
MEEIFKKAKELNMKAISATDHDTTLGLETENRLSLKYGVPFIPAVEFTAVEKGIKLHILGYNIDMYSEELKEYSLRLLNYLNEKSKVQIKLLQQNGINIKEEEYFKESNGGPLYRAKLLKTLARQGYIKENEIMNSLKKYFGAGGICYVEDTFKYSSFNEIIKLIKRNNGIVVLAHPSKIKKKDEHLYKELINCELLDGIELYHPSVDTQTKKELEEVIRTRGILYTGGSDYHGIYNKLNTPVCGIKLPDEVYDNLRRFLKNKI